MYTLHVTSCAHSAYMASMVNMHSCTDGRITTTSLTSSQCSNVDGIKMACYERPNAGSQESGCV